MDVLSWPSVTSGMSTYSLVQLRGTAEQLLNLPGGNTPASPAFPCRTAGRICVSNSSTEFRDSFISSNIGWCYMYVL